MNRMHAVVVEYLSVGYRIGSEVFGITVQIYLVRVSAGNIAGP
jgi:hypothetical protein